MEQPTALSSLCYVTVPGILPHQYCCPCHIYDRSMSKSIHRKLGNTAAGIFDKSLPGRRSC
jgi:hypothetical protein